jgi:hypothetical protein
MRNKQDEQRKNKLRHLKELRIAKAKRRGEPMLERIAPLRLERPKILIVCEGRNTEPSYFEQFRLTSAKIVAIGEGYNTITLVNRAIQLMKDDSYEQVWCVFDKDDFLARNFNQAIRKALLNGLKVAYSNQSFEYWLILHFEDHQGGAMPRTDYNDKINDYINPLGAYFDGNDKLISSDFFNLLDAIDPNFGIPRKNLAINRARRNFNAINGGNPAIEESSTKVYLLVEEILKYV